ncbi:MAG TPA: pyridoxal-phosphate dependent enzyme [Candidatus Limnocylindria bacterium]|nr:pyridoxal-phosphate dependent enzyme [Candidatus Limnocylindria bacterium]
MQARPNPSSATTAATPTPQDVRDAAARIGTGIVRTPTARSRVLSAAIGGDVYLKLENRQATGAYKERGALNALLSLSDEERARGVVTMSAGNHGQAVAYHGTRLGVKTTVVMPETTPLLKVRRTRDYGADVVLVGETFAHAAEYAHDLVARTGARLIHPYDDAHVIAGQGTATLELLADVGEDLDVLLIPIGGGGLISGATLAVAAAGSRAQVVGVQTELYPSLRASRGGAPVAPGGVTIAEGIAVTRLGALPLAVIEDAVREVLLVGESAIETAIASLLEDEKLVVEGAGAAAVAALREHVARFAGKRVGIILCGGNIDLGTLASVIVRARLRAGRVVRIRVRMVDRPGELASAATAIAEAKVNVLDVTHHRVLGTVPSKYAELDVTIELERAEDLPGVLAAVRARGFDADVVRD